MKDGVVNFTEEGLQVNGIDETNTLFVVGKLNKSVFKEYKSLGKVAVANFSLLRNVTNRYTEEVEVVVKDNVLCFTTKGREFEVVLPDVETVNQSKNEPTLEYTNVLKLSSNFLKEAVKNADTLEKGLSVTLFSEGNKVVAECGNDDKGREIVEVEKVNEPFNVKFGEPLRKVVSVMDGEVEVSLKTDYPATLKYSDTEMELKFIVASMEK
ncbi:MAG: hypothetical protein Q7R52_00115 [archaeon]|nr:hypothetical protein [archaeon]